MKIRLLPAPFIIGLFVLTFGIFFKIMHWPGGTNLLMAGTFQETLFTALCLFEIKRSKGVSMRTKYIFGAFLLLVYISSYLFFRGLALMAVVFTTGLIYLTIFRQMLFSQKAAEKVVFSFKTDDKE